MDKPSIDFFEFIEKSNQCQSVDELFRCLEEFTTELGFDIALYSLLTDHPSIAQKANHSVIRSYPEDWMKYYFAKGYENIDPVRKYIPKYHSGAFAWEQLSNFYTLADAEQRVLDEAKEAKLFDGIGVPLFGAAGEIAGMGFASSHGGVEMNNNTLSMIHSLAQQFHQVYKNLISTNLSAESKIKPLTRREKEVLIWVSAGKNNWEISEILSVSEHAVDYHLRNIYKKLDVNSRVSAVVKGIRYHHIVPF